MANEWPRVLASWKEESEKPITATEDEILLSRALLGHEDAIGKLAGRTFRTKDVRAGTDAQVKKSQILLPFCAKLEKTYANGRMSPKNALVQVLVATQEGFTVGYPQGCSRPSDVSETFGLGSTLQGYMYLLRTQGAVLSTPAQKRRTGRAVARIPATGDARQIVRPMPMISVFLRPEGKVGLL